MSRTEQKARGWNRPSFYEIERAVGRARALRRATIRAAFARIRPRASRLDSHGQRRPS